MKKRPAKISINPDTQIVTLNRNELRLPHKINAVLVHLITSAPHVVSRETLIEKIWDGNYLTGEKGLTHALWVIRAALKENGAPSTVIKTLPRKGYAWMGPELSDPQTLPYQKLAAIAATLIAGIMVSTFQQSPAHLTSNTSLTPANPLVASTGTLVYQNGRDWIIDHIDGCRMVIQAKPTTLITAPAFSEDGEKIALRIEKNGTCKLTVIEFKTRQKQEFDTCPATA